MAKMFRNLWYVCLSALMLSVCLHLCYILISIGQIADLTKLPESEEEKIARHICGQACVKLSEFFINLRSRNITPKVLDCILNVGDFNKTKEIVNSFLSLKLFNEHVVEVEVLEAEVKAYKVFKERNKKVKHFAHEFAELAKGLSKNSIVFVMQYILLQMRQSK